MSSEEYIGKPGNTRNEELTRKNLFPILTTEGSGAKPGIIGLTFERAIVHKQEELKRA